MSQYPPMQPHGFAPREAPGATAGLVLGICSLVFNFPLVGLILAWLGFVKSKSAKLLCESNPGVYSNAGVATAGYVVSIIGLILGGLGTLCGCGYIIFVVLAIAGGVAAGP